MCGIAGIHRRGRALPGINRLATELLLSIEKRGTDATGLMAMNDTGKVQWIRQATRASKFVADGPTFNPKARTVLLHTRWATTGGMDWRNAHPVANGTCAAVHNGTIYNATELFTAFGMKRYATVDSEVIPALVSEMGWDNAKDAFDLMEGGCATAVINAERPAELILARTESFPLVYYVTPKAIIWASTELAIRDAWRATFGTNPTGGTFHVLDEWTMVHVNGQLTETVIRKPRPKPAWLRSGYTFRPLHDPKKGKRKRPKGGKGKTRKAAIPVTRTRQLALDVPVVSAHQKLARAVDDMFSTPARGLEREPWMDDVVTDLMRIEGYDRAEAEELVYGTTWEA